MPSSERAPTPVPDRETERNTARAAPAAKHVTGQRPLVGRRYSYKEWGIAGPPRLVCLRAHDVVGLRPAAELLAFFRCGNSDEVLLLAGLLSWASRDLLRVETVVSRAGVKRIAGWRRDCSALGAVMLRQVPRDLQEDVLSDSEAGNIEVVLRYFDGCNSGDVDELMSTLDPDVRHYFLPPTFPPIKGREHLANFWRKYKENLDPVWKIDHIIASGDEVVSEWSCRWTNPASEARLMARGSEWYVMRDSKILEVRAYFIADVESSVELASFPYAERGYLPTND